MAETKLKVSVISPEKVIYTGEADYVNLPGSVGYFGVLINHSPLVSELQVGILEIKAGNQNYKMVVDGGFAEVKNNEIKVLVTGGDAKENINLEKAEKALQEAIDSNSKTRDFDIKKAKARVLIHKS